MSISAGDRIDSGVEANFTTNIDMIGQAGGYASRGYTAWVIKLPSSVMSEQIFQEISSAHTLEHEKIDTTLFLLIRRDQPQYQSDLYQNGQRKNCYDGKSHMTLHPPLGSCEQVFTGARLAHFNIPNWARELLQPVARESGLKIACDIQDVVDVERSLSAGFYPRLRTYLFFSAANYPDPSPLFIRYLSLNPELVIICGMGDTVVHWQPGRHSLFPPVTLDLPVVDTNGAGDTLAVAFLSSHVLDGLPLEESILRGQIAARYKCGINASSGRMIIA